MTSTRAVEGPARPVVVAVDFAPRGIPANSASCRGIGRRANKDPENACA